VYQGHRRFESRTGDAMQMTLDQCSSYLADRSRSGEEYSGGWIDESAQVLLVPRLLNRPLPVPVAITVTAIPTLAEHGGVGVGQHLPKAGRGGDLMTVMDDQRQCTLWFCVRDADASPSGHAQWAQVLLGDSFIGQA
jgi:hypothetical protein